MNLVSRFCRLPVYALGLGLGGGVIPFSFAAADQAASHRRQQHSARADAVALAIAGNVNAAEAALKAQNHARPGTAAWHAESAQRLMSVASTVARSGQAESVRELALRALDHLQHVERMDARAGARTYAMAGMIHERFLADFESAKASYQAAIQANPSDRSTKEKLTRLEAKAETGSKPKG